MTAQTTQIAANEGRTLSLSEILRRCDLLNIGSSQEDASQRAAAHACTTAASA